MDVEMKTVEDNSKHTKPEVVIDTTFDESAVYSGKVKAFRPSFRIKITPDQDLSALGVKNSCVEASVSDVHTNQSPAVLTKDQAVEFRLRKDNFGVYAIHVSGPSGAVIIGTSDEKPRTGGTPLNNGQTYQGTIKTFLWSQGFGYVTLDNKDAFQAPAFKNEKAKKRFEKTGEIWFHRSDLKSTDPAVGAGQGEACQFSLYTDDKGLGAQNITRLGGAPFSGCRTNVYRGPPRKKSKKKKGKKGNQNPFQAQLAKALKNMGFGPMRGGGNKNMPMMIPMGGMNMMGGMPMMMNMGGQPYMMMMGGGKKKRRNKKKKNKGKKVVNVAGGEAKSVW